MPRSKKKEECPTCGGPLKRVVQSPGSALNRDQFDSVKAGDYYCPTCPSNDRGNQPYCYWWESELPDKSPPVKTTRIFAITWDTELGPLWMNKDNLLLCLSTDQHVGQNLDVKVQDVTDHIKLCHHLEKELGETIWYEQPDP